MRVPLPIFAKPDYILSELGIRNPSVDINAIVKHYGFCVEVSNSPNGYLGALSRPERLILLSEESTPQWQRFITAHLFGHAILHSHLSDQFVEKSLRTSPNALEDQADNFAYELLVPKNWYLARVDYLSQPSMIQLFDVPVYGLGLSRF